MNKFSKLEFQLNYYFEMYKDKSFRNAKEFKTHFTKKHGEFPLLKELYLMIDKYQIKKYGQALVYTFEPFRTKEEERKISIRNIQRKYYHRSKNDKK